MQLLAVVAGVGVGYASLLCLAIVTQLVTNRASGPAVVIVAPQETAPLDPADIDALTRALPGANVSRALVPESLATTGTLPLVNVESVDADFFSVYGLQAASGTFFRPADDLRANPVAVVGGQVAQTLFGSVSAATGKSLRVQNVSLTVIGVLAPPSSPDLASFNQNVFVPLQTGRLRLVGAGAPTELVIGPASGANASNLARLASHVLAVRYPRATSAFSVQVHVETQAPASLPRLVWQAAASNHAEFVEAKRLTGGTSRPGQLTFRKPWRRRR